MLGAVSMKTHSVPSRLAALAMSPTPRCRLQRQFGVVAQLVPERQRALWISVDEQTRPRGFVGIGGQMRRQRALAGSTLAGSKDDDIHANFSPRPVRADDFPFESSSPLTFCLSMIFSESRFPLFQIML